MMDEIIKGLRQATDLLLNRTPSERCEAIVEEMREMNKRYTELLGLIETRLAIVELRQAAINGPFADSSDDDVALRREGEEDAAK